MVTDNADATRTLNLLGVVSSICGVITTIGGVLVLFSDSFGAFFGGGSSGRR